MEVIKRESWLGLQERSIVVAGVALHHGCRKGAPAARAAILGPHPSFSETSIPLPRIALPAGHGHATPSPPHPRPACHDSAAASFLCVLLLHHQFAHLPWRIQCNHFYCLPHCTATATATERAAVVAAEFQHAARSIAQVTAQHLQLIGTTHRTL